MTLPLHDHLRQAAHALGDEPVPLDRLLALHGPAVQGTLLVLLAAPCVLPVPGVGNVMGLALLLLSLAFWRGESRPALPARVARWPMPAHWARRVLNTLADLYRLASRCSRERLVPLATAQPRGWMAPKVALMGALIFLPIPLGNVLPALALVLLGLGLVHRDGVAVLLAMLAAVAAVVYTVALGAAAWTWLLAPVAAWLGLPA